MTFSPRLKVPLLLFLALTLNHSLLADARIREVRPDAMLLVAVAAGIVGGSERGALVGFLAGLLADLPASTPLGLSALTFCVVGFAVGALQSSLIRSAWWIPPLTVLVATAAGVLLYALMGAIIGRSHFLRPELLVVAAGVGAMNMVLSLVVVPAVSWAMAAGPDRSYAR